ncbi:FliH/SctL family protein [Oryzibacter oryziterrae]|uniref:FliH/SctL family protein n=1 Tax=Oryzibacter oryziterrae TaxID=2766474 RepID=UPI001F183BE5|nr:FliH/SctL family protein [Oryzibacter oryziterrae]
MAAPARFLFDTDFSAPLPRPEPVAPPEPTVMLRDHEAALAAAEAAGYQRGLAEGRESAEARSAGRLVEEATRLANAAQSILAVLDTERFRIEAEAMRLAEVIGLKLAGSLIERQPRELVLAVIEDAFVPLRKAPHLVVRLAKEDSAAIHDELTRLARERGFEGRLVVLGEADMARGDCRIEWADGGMILDRVATEAAVARAIENHLLPSLAGNDADKSETGEPS